ncbi:MAG: ATPase, T2SS/T4P/T4SS family, partial [Candidatus Nanopelagicales bacterium]|nr:ATPase, T2SS/T4P/T4SS family [Candidatus Nanopelagicales bacterium]
MRQLVDVLVSAGLITSEQWDRAVTEQQRTGASLGRILVDQGFISERQLVESLATQVGLRFVDLTDIAVDGSAVASISGTMARRHTVLPIGFDDGRLILAMADPADVFAVDDVRSASGHDVTPVVAVRSDVIAAIDRFHRSEEELGDITSALDVEEEEDEAGDLGMSSVADAPIVKFVNMLITQAIADRASDIHLEPTERDLRVRFRIDGVLHEMMRSPRSIQSGVISRLKIMSDIDISERRIPQDGRMSVNAHGSKVDLRVATLPTVWGEKVVMRILDNTTAMLDLTELGFSEGNYRRFSASFTKPYGMILVVGPTGSGKSTTLYAT